MSTIQIQCPCRGMPTKPTACSYCGGQGFRIMEAEHAAELDEIEQRVVAGIEWLDKADPTGGFHFRWLAGIRPGAPVGASVPADTIDRYRDYYQARELFEQLWKRLMRAERKAVMR